MRQLAAQLGIKSAAHLSDIEHGRRMPSDDLLKKIASVLARVGASYEELRSLDYRLDPGTRDWVQENPGVGRMLREARESGVNSDDLLDKMRDILRKEAKKDKK